MGVKFAFESGGNRVDSPRLDYQFLQQYQDYVIHANHTIYPDSSHGG